MMIFDSGLLFLGHPVCEAILTLYFEITTTTRVQQCDNPKQVGLTHKLFTSHIVGENSIDIKALLNKTDLFLCAKYSCFDRWAYKTTATVC